MRVLVIGLGSIGTRRARLVRSLGHDAVGFDPHRQETPDVELVASLEDGLDQADAAIVATPSADHYASAQACLNASVPTLVEKPIALRSREALELARLSQSTRTLLGVAMNLRFHKGLQGVRAALDGPVVGQPLRASIWCGSWLPGWRPGVDYRHTYSASALAGGGVLLDAIHELDYLLWLLGPARTVGAVVDHVSDLETDTEDVVLLTVEMTSGALAQISLDYFDRAYHRGCRIVCTEGTIEWSWEAATIRVSRGADSPPDQRSVTQDVDDMYRDELAHFLTSVDTGEPPTVGALEAAGPLQIVEAARESARSGRFIELERSDIQLRKARLADADMILRWRNDPAARAASRASREIQCEEHKQWLEAKLHDPDAELLIVEDGGQPVGHVRLDRTSAASIEVSIAIDRAQRGRGVSRQVLLAAIDRARSVAGASELTADIHHANERSQRAFRSVGFRKASGRKGEFVRWTFALRPRSTDPGLG